MIIHFLPRRLKKVLHGNLHLSTVVNLAFYFVVLLVMMIVGIMIVEGYSLQQSIWLTWQTFTTVGYGDNPAQSASGQWLTMLVTTVGIMFLGAFFGAYLDNRTDKNMRRRKGMIQDSNSGGFVVINFPGEEVATTFIDEIRVPFPDARVCFVDNEIDELPPSVAVIPRVHFVRGSFIAEETYANARVESAVGVLVFPFDPGNPDSDASTNTIVEALHKFKGSETKVIYIQVGQKNTWLFREHPNALSVNEALEVLAVVQEFNDPHSYGAVERLLKNTEGANPKTVKPQRVVGMTWGEYQLKVIQAAERTGIEINTFALVQNGVPHSCPSFNTRIKSTDLLIVLAHEGFDWYQFETQLAA